MSKDDCECGCGSQVMYELKDILGKVNYRICANCQFYLVNNALTPEMYKSLLNNGHDVNEHLLHGDFYDEEGNALQSHI